MPNSFSDTTFAQTYKDDWKDSDNYYRVLYNSGRPLQARELIQQQTIAHNQTNKFARSIYQDGSPVIAGGLTLQYREFVKLADLTTNLSVGDIVTGGTTSVQGVITHIAERENADNPLTIYVKYINNGILSGGTTSIKFSAGEVLTSGANSVTVQSTNTLVNPAFGFGTFADLNSSTYFLKGFFVQVNDQSVVVDRYTDYPTTTLGFIIVEDVVTSDDTDALYDNQNELPNYTAPGADRYRIRATLATSDQANSDDDFYPIEPIQNGRFVYDPTDPNYSIIGDVIAERTKEESGDYIVRGYNSHMESGNSDAQLHLHIDPGTGYVQGYRTEFVETSVLSVPKSRTTTTINNEQIAAEFGNYIKIDGASLTGIPNVSEIEQLNLNDDSSYGGSVIGTARVRSVVQDGDDYRFHIIDVDMNTGQSFRATKSIGTGASKFGNVILQNSIAVLEDAANNNAFFEFPYDRPQSISDISMTVQRYFTGTTDGTGQVTLTLTDTTETFANTTSWIVSSTSDGEIYSATITGAGTQSATITVADTSEPIAVIAYVGKSQASVRTKTLTEGASTVGTLVDSDGQSYLQLSHKDIYQLNSVTGSGSENITERFRLDNGQRDNFYDYGRVYLKSGYSDPGSITVNYDYFAHGATGDFFAVNSYIGQVTYDNIPSYRQRNGEVVELRNALDFRSVKNSSGNFGSGAIVFELPSNTDLITMDTVYYNKRKDALTLHKGGYLIYEEGTPAIFPKYPNTTDDTLKIKGYELNGYTDGPLDVQEEFIDNRRYTMRDIGAIERRIDNLEEAVTLGLLELEATTLEVLDSNGVPRYKNGLFADNFKNLRFADTTNTSHTTSIDAERNEVIPSYIDRQVVLEYDSDNSTTVRRGNYVMIPYEEILLQTQVEASGTENVNPYNVFVVEGYLELRPSIDTWKVEKTEEEIIDVYKDNRFSSTLAGAKKLAKPLSTLPVRLDDNGNGISRPNPTPEIWRETTASPPDTDILEVEELPYIRHRKVFFRATGLKPDHRYFLFFGNVDMSNYVKEDAEDKLLPSFVGINAEKYTGDAYKDNTSHPEGVTELYSDAQGVIVGSFFIPRNDEIKFTSGVKNVLLIDVSTADLTSATSYASTTYEATGELHTSIITRYINTAPRVSTGSVSRNNDRDVYYYVDKNTGFVRETTVRRSATSSRTKTYDSRNLARDAGRADTSIPEPDYGK